MTTKIRKRIWTVPELKTKITNGKTSTRYTQAQVEVLTTEIKKQEKIIHLLRSLIDWNSLPPSTITALGALGINPPRKTTHHTQG